MKYGKWIQSIFAFLLVVLMAGCANNQSMYAPAPPMGEQQIQYGNVIRIDPMTIQSKHQMGLGAVMGAAAGGLLGSAIGQGSGRDVAMVLGAIGGGIFGSDEQAKMDAKPGMHVMVRLDNGVTVAVTVGEVRSCTPQLTCVWSLSASRWLALPCVPGVMS